MTKENKPEFDKYAVDYHEMIQTAVGESSEYAAEYKVLLTKRIFQKDFKNILDYGCGVGRIFPYLKSHFSKATIHAFDVSSKSLDITCQTFPWAKRVNPENLEEFRGKFDLIITAGVFHHIPLDERKKAMDDIKSLLSSEGHYINFEHNPYNPITQRIVDNCPLDENAILLKMNDSVELLKGSKLDVVSKGYSFFFPQFLSIFRRFEWFLRWLPIGGQYWIVAKRP
jgi:SAM-dependent methyltransferase